MSDKPEKGDRRETTRRRTPDRRKKPITNRRGPQPGRRSGEVRKPEKAAS